MVEYLFKWAGIEINYSDNFLLDEIDELHDEIRIIHTYDSYFKVITSDSMICDCVTSIQIKKPLLVSRAEIIFELGLDTSSTGFVSKLVEGNYTLFLQEYTDEQKQMFEIFREQD